MVKPSFVITWRRRVSGTTGHAELRTNTHNVVTAQALALDHVRAEAAEKGYRVLWSYCDWVELRVYADATSSPTERLRYYPNREDDGWLPWTEYDEHRRQLADAQARVERGVALQARAQRLREALQALGLSYAQSDPRPVEDVDYLNWRFSRRTGCNFGAPLAVEVVLTFASDAKTLRWSVSGHEVGRVALQGEAEVADAPWSFPPEVVTWIQRVFRLTTPESSVAKQL